MQVQFTCYGQPSWVAELLDLSEREVLKEFVSRQPQYSPKDLDLMWVEKGYLGRIATHVPVQIVGRFWELLDEVRAIKPLQTVRGDRAEAKKVG